MAPLPTNTKTICVLPPPWIQHKLDESKVPPAECSGAEPTYVWTTGAATLSKTSSCCTNTRTATRIRSLPPASSPTRTRKNSRFSTLHHPDESDHLVFRLSPVS